LKLRKSGSSILPWISWAVDFWAELTKQVLFVRSIDRAANAADRKIILPFIVETVAKE